MLAKQLLMLSLLPVFSVQAESAVDIPSMDFLEYLGGVENEVDGEMSSPVELDLEAVLLTRNNDNEQNKEVNEEAVDE